MERGGDPTFLGRITVLGFTVRVVLGLRDGGGGERGGAEATP